MEAHLGSVKNVYKYKQDVDAEGQLGTFLLIFTQFFILVITRTILHSKPAPFTHIIITMSDYKPTGEPALTHQHHFHDTS